MRFKTNLTGKQIRHMYVVTHKFLADSNATNKIGESMVENLSTLLEKLYDNNFLFTYGEIASFVDANFEKQHYVTTDDAFTIIANIKTDLCDVLAEIDVMRNEFGESHFH